MGTADRPLDASALRDWAHAVVSDLILHIDEINRLNVFRIPRRPAALQTELHLGTVIVPVPQPPQELWIVVGPDDASLGPVHLCPCSAPAKVDQRRQNQHEEQVEHSTPPWTEYTRAVGSGCVRSA